MDSGRLLVSPGQRPVWRDGELFFLSPDGIERVSISANARTWPLNLGPAELVLAHTGIESFDVSPDGNTFAVTRRSEASDVRVINVVTNWFEELKERVPPR